jgi:hypothetical protein
VLVGGNFHRTTSINGATLDAGALGGEDAFVQMLDANGQVRWTFQTNTINPDPADGEWLLGAAAGPSGEVFALLNMATATGSSLHLLKLAHPTGP